jgi:uncharacterized protein YggT (Ycf19 family)
VNLFYPPITLGFILADIIGLVMLCIFADIIMSWIYSAGGRVPLYNPIIRFVRKVSKSATDPLRKALPVLQFGAVGLDLAPMIALMLLGFLQRIVDGI